MTLAARLRPSRYTILALCLLFTALSVALALFHPLGWVLVAAFAALSLLGLSDVAQKRHTILRMFPVIGHVRWLAEFIRPEIRQYVVESDEEAAPFSRSQRSLVYQRAKGDSGEHPFGTLMDVYRDGYEFIGHSTLPVPAADPPKSGAPTPPKLASAPT